MAETLQPRPSMLTRIFRDLIAASRRDGSIGYPLGGAGLAGGAQLAVLVRDGLITATVKRKGVQVGATELLTFALRAPRHGSVPDDAQLLTPLVQGTRDVDGEIWFYVTLRWPDDPHPSTGAPHATH